MVFWWTGRGFLSLLFLIGVFGACGALVTFTLGNEAFERWPWLWGVGVIPAAIVNWFGGSRLNRRSVNPLHGGLRQRAVYRARHRFLSLPMELWSGPMLVLAAFLIVKGLV